MDPVRGLAGILCLFVGATLTSFATITTSIVVVHALVMHTHPFPSGTGAGDLLTLAVFGIPLFIIGHVLAPGKLTAGGRALVTAGLMWWLLSGSCYATWYSGDKSGLAIAGAVVITSISALLFGLGAARRETDEA
jgi:hypothetical protein